MRTHHTSIFHLIDLFRQGKKKLARLGVSSNHCEHSGLHDFYCDAEKPFLGNS